MNSVLKSSNWASELIQNTKARKTHRATCSRDHGHSSCPNMNNHGSHQYAKEAYLDVISFPWFIWRTSVDYFIFQFLHRKTLI